MTVTLVGTRAIAKASSTTLDVPLPAGISDGDLGVMVLQYSHTNGDPTAPSGWTQIGEHSQSGSTRTRLYRKVLTAGEASTNVTFTHPSAHKMAGAVAVINGADLATLVTAVSSSSDACPVATPAENGVGIAFWSQRTSSPATSITAPSGFTLGQAAFGTGGGAACAAVATRMTEAATQGGGSWAPSPANVATTCWTIAIEPIEEAPPDPPAGWRVVEVAGVTETDLQLIEVDGVTETPLTIDRGLSLLETMSFPAYAAHRGGANTGGRCENTLYAYQQSLANDHPATVLEMDTYLLDTGGGATIEERICLTHAGNDLSEDGGKVLEADGVTVVTGTAASKTVTQWDTYKIKPRTGITAPLAAATRWVQIVDLLNAHPTKCALVETKIDTVVEPLVDSIFAHGLEGRVMVQSLVYTRAATAASMGAYANAALSDFSTYSAATVAAAGIKAVTFDRTNPNLATLCGQAHAAGLKVWTYTVNNTTTRNDVLAAGVDGIFTDVPGVVNN